MSPYGVLVLDGPTATPPDLAPGSTVITVHNDDGTALTSPDVRIRQDPLNKDRLVLEVGGRSHPISMVTIPDETRLIGHPEGTAPMQRSGLVQ